MPRTTPRVVIIGAGIGGLTVGALLAQTGYNITVLEAEAYLGGSAGTFYHSGYRFDAGATLAGGFQPNGPHALLGEQLQMRWPVRPVDTAWTVHLPNRQITLSRDNADVLNQFPESAPFWEEQQKIADLGWSMAANHLAWPPTNIAEIRDLIRVGISGLPANLRLIPYAFRTVHHWLARHKLTHDREFVRFVDAQLLISAQTITQNANALYSATALDLPRQGVHHVVGGIGSLAQTLADNIEALGGQVLKKQRAYRIAVENGRAVGVHSEYRGRQQQFFPGDFVVANLTPWSLDTLLGGDSPLRLQREVGTRPPGWGAFVLHLGLDGARLPAGLHEHHQIITTLDGPLGEGRSIFVSLSPDWDTTRAPEGHRAATITTHTAITPWWEILARDPAAYHARKNAYSERILAAIEHAIPGFRTSITLCMDGTPVTYQTWTHRHQGMVGGFPQTSLFRARGPRTGLQNVRLVGDSIFPGQSTAGVTVGAFRVARDISRALPLL